jgi:hypothetical protein
LASLNKLAANGKTTKWMLDSLKTYLAAVKLMTRLHFCMGGTNDIWGNYPSEAIANLQAIVNLGNSKGSKVIIVTGYEPKGINIIRFVENVYKKATHD